MKITWNSLTFTLLVKFLQNDKCAHHLIESFYGTQIGVGTSGFGRVLVLPHPNQTKKIIKRLYLNMKIPMVSSSNLCVSFNIKNVMWFEWKQVLNSFIHMCFYRGTWLEGLAYGLTNIVILEVWWSTCYCTIISLLPNITKINNIKPMNKWYLAYLFMWTIWGK
jgi:hypothetical protein